MKAVLRLLIIVLLLNLTTGCCHLRRRCRLRRGGLGNIPLTGVGNLRAMAPSLFDAEGNFLGTQQDLAILAAQLQNNPAILSTNGALNPLQIQSALGGLGGAGNGVLGPEALRYSEAQARPATHSSPPDFLAHEAVGISGATTEQKHPVAAD